MTEKIIVAGAGGQGIMLLGKILAQAAMYEDKYVSWFPSYGAEVRGGTAYCMVVISDYEIGSPYVDKADTLIVMNEPSFEKFKNRVKNKGLLIVNSSLVKTNMDKSFLCAPKQDKKLFILSYPFTDIAARLSDVRVANMVALGCYLTHKKTVTVKNIFKTFKEIIPRDKRHFIRINKMALKEGIGLK